MKKILILVGPSGVGKTTLGNYLKHELQIEELVSHTTRPKRKGEVQDVDYHFITKEEFDKLTKLESVCYAGNYYCVSKSEVDEKLEKHDMVYAVTEINGYYQIKEQYPDETVGIFITATEQSLKDRMISRGDSAENVAIRLKKLHDSKELDNGQYCDYTIINDTLVQAQKDLKDLVFKCKAR